jgi:DeoR/GlpR family transcriptional regulator of sugar metabolism
MGKTSRENIARRQLWLLKELFEKHIVPIAALSDTYQKEFHITDSRSLQADLVKLKSIGLPIEMTATEVRVSAQRMRKMWHGTLVGKRLSKRKSMESKERLAKKTVDFIKDNRDDISVLMLGTGTTVWEAAKEILTRENELDITTIYTASVLVLDAFVSRRPGDVTLRMAGGALDERTAWLKSRKGVQFLSKAPVDAVVTSFMGLCREGFRTAQDYEVDEKLMNLRPHKRCKFVVIPIEWSKIDHEDGELVAEQIERKKGRDVLDFLGGTRQYVIVTDPPRGKLQGRDRDKLDLLEYWRDEKGVQVLRTSRAKEP